MIIAALILAALLIFGLGFVAGACWSAPCGYQCDDGFHLVDAVDVQAAEGARAADSLLKR